MYALVVSLGKVCYQFHMHCGSSPLWHIALRTCCSTYGPAERGEAKQGLDVVQYRASNITIAKSKRIILAVMFFLQNKRAGCGAENKFRLDGVDRHGGVTGATSKACSVALVNNTG
jgi:hypothetical protein